MINNNTKQRIYTSIFLFFLFYLIIISNFMLAYMLIIVGIYSILEFLYISKKIFKNNFYKFFLNTLCIVYIFVFFSLFFFFSNFLQSKIVLYLLLFGCIASDIGGFVFGKIFKGPKITKISPKKTYTGAFGSILFTCTTLSILFSLFGIFETKLIFIAIITSLACQIGDLFFSFLKRKAKMKDTGKILPGHGGILDRFDGILFGVPVGGLSILFLY